MGWGKFFRSLKKASCTTFDIRSLFYQSVTDRIFGSLLLKIRRLCFVFNLTSKLSKPESIADLTRARDWNVYVFISYAPPSGGLRLAKERKSRIRQPMGFHITSGYRLVRPTFRSARRDEEEERKLLIPNNC